MPLYSFKNEMGDVEEFFFHMSDAPAIGSVIRKRGLAYTRIPDVNQAMPVADRHFISQQLPRNYTHHRNAGGKFNEKGQPQFESMRQVKETIARSQGEEGVDGGYAYD